MKHTDLRHLKSKTILESGNKQNDIQIEGEKREIIF